MDDGWRLVDLVVFIILLIAILGIACVLWHMVMSAAGV